MKVSERNTINPHQNWNLGLLEKAIQPVLMYFLTGRGTDLLNTRICSKLQSIQHIILANKSLKERPVTLYLPKNRGYVLMYFLTGRGTDLLNTRICSKLQSIQHIILANKSLKVVKYRIQKYW
ncbi:UPF0371 protein [Frankliniella fusca]|uniref:UPF0371 protein n=1 Tax=Frankliniella fusca TaxID=407009 RepID=A0AAE1H5J2_9NEOP|nr:UPF0371 protein [Frankliniella fusca]